MNARRTEDYAHTAEQVNGYIEQALVLLDEHELTPNERAEPLPVVVNQLGTKQVFYEQAMPIDLSALKNARH